jgi:hypothetical protein
MGMLVDDLLNLARGSARPGIAGRRLTLVEEVIAGLKFDISDRQIEWSGTLPYVGM